MCPRRRAWPCACGALLVVSFNRSKGNKTEISKSELIERSTKKTPYCRVLSAHEMDLIELSAYGNIQRDEDPEDSRICSIQ
ncbi:hypothetical protein Taro_048362 [Colocasia esculenta]|uniref:Uncharacterized protein n=1 Tax=Colocasia esculenta TaxID=4460 RepID=A0A843X7E3_COLES|nr:hypothetical protein [Colocasia esculenta]